MLGMTEVFKCAFLGHMPKTFLLKAISGLYRQVSNEKKI